MSPDEPQPRRKFPKWLPQLLGYSVSAGSLIWVLHGYPIGELGPTLRALDWRWVVLAVIADLAVYVVHAWRWTTLLEPDRAPRPLAHGAVDLYRAVCQ